MKRKKHFLKRGLAVFLSFTLCLGMFQITTIAAEDEKVHDSSFSNSESNTNETTGETTTTTTSGWTDIDDSEKGEKVESSEVKVEITVTDRNDNVLEESGTVNGESTTTTTTTTETTEPGTPDDESLTVDVEIGETTTTETPGKFETTETTPETSTTEAVDGDIPYAGDVTVNLKPGQENVKGTASLTDKELADLLYYYDKDYPMNEILSEPKVETNDKGETVTTSTSQEDGQYVKTVVTEKPDGSKVEEKTTVQLKGEVNDKGGKDVTEFIVTTVTTITNAPVTEEKVEEIGSTTSSDTVTSDPVFEDTTYITLPERPEPSESTAEDGTKTVVVVEEILDESGAVVGYQTVKTVTSADGKQVSSESSSVWGTKTTVSTAIQKDTTTTTNTITNLVTTTTTTLITQGTTVSGHEITATDRTVWASMGEVKPNGNNGDVQMRPAITPDVAEPAAGNTDTTTDLYTRPDSTLEAETTPTGKKDEKGNDIYKATITLKDGSTIDVEVAKDSNGNYIPVNNDFEWFGEYGLESAIRVNASSNGQGTWQPHQFVLVSKTGERFYVYCADFEVSPANGAAYDMNNIEDATYYSKEDAEHIRYIAENGYWGTSSGTGSLSALKAWLKAQGKENTGLTDEQIEKLTDGEALTATQAAIWHFGNSGTTGVGTTYNDIVGKYNTDGVYSNLSGEKELLTQKLYEFLIKGKKEAPHETTFITEEVFATNSSITVKDKATGIDENGNTVFKMTDDKKDIYNADVSFGMSVQPSKNGDLIVQVIVDGKVIETRRLVGENSEDQNYGRITPDENGNYTIQGLELPNGSTITLKLSGTQDLAKGVYLYTCTTGHNGSQTFVGLGQGKREVDLSVDINFTVTEPEATITKTESGNKQEKTDTVVNTRKDVITQQQVSAEITVSTTTTTEDHTEWSNSWNNNFRPDEEGDDDVDTGDDDVDTGDDDVDAGDDDADVDEDIPDDIVPLTDIPGEGIEIFDDAVPLAGMGEGIDIFDEDVPLSALPGDELVDLFDEDVPLASVPRTGDASALWYMVVILSAMGLLYLKIFDQKRNKRV